MAAGNFLFCLLFQVFISFYLRPENGALVTNALNCPTANKAAIGQIKSDIASGTTIFVASDYFSKMIFPSSFKQGS
jgi:putrescine transport system substrate-binding protein